MTKAYLIMAFTICGSLNNTYYGEDRVLAGEIVLRGTTTLLESNALLTIVRLILSISFITPIFAVI